MKTGIKTNSVIKGNVTLGRRKNSFKRKGSCVCSAGGADVV